VFEVTNRDLIFVDYKFAWLTEFLLNEELLRSYNTPCVTLLADKYWRKTKEKIFGLRNNKVDVRKLEPCMNSNWFVPALSDLSFDIFRHWVPSSDFDVGYFIRTYDGIKILGMNLVIPGLDDFPILDFSVLGDLDNLGLPLIELSEDDFGIVFKAMWYLVYDCKVLLPYFVLSHNLVGDLRFRTFLLIYLQICLVILLNFRKPCRNGRIY
jgi:hypothetical protein